MNNVMRKIKQILKNKKVMIGILVPVIAVVCGFSVWAITDTVIEHFGISLTEKKEMDDYLGREEELSIQEEQASSILDQKSNEEETLVPDRVVVPPTDDLTAEDKALKAEIQAVSDTKVDFRDQKTESIGTKNHNLTYSAIKGNGTFADTDMITYQNEAGDQFIYHLQSGRLVRATMNSLKTQKTAQSISLDEAEKIAYAYAEKNCDIKTHPLDVKETLEDGYLFSYEADPILGYDCANTFFVKVGFDGNIIGVANYTVAFDYIEVLIDEKELQEKLDKQISRFVEGSYFSQLRIAINNGKPYLNVKIYDAEKGGLHNGFGIWELDYKLKQP